MKFHLFVGGFGSNAFVERDYWRYVFAAEKLSPDLNHLRVIVAHEIGHIYHNVMLQNDGMDWGKPSGPMRQLICIVKALQHTYQSKL